MTVARLPFDCWHLIGLHTSCWIWWLLLDCCCLFLHRSRLCGALQQCWRFIFLQCTVTDSMDTPSYSSPIQTYVDSHCVMRLSNDTDRSDPKDLCSLGVVDLDLSISPDAFGLRAFDISKPLMCMLPGSSPHELHLMIPDLGIAPEEFHDVVIENLAASPAWRSRHISSGDVTSLRQRWPKAVFRTLRRRSKDVERLRRFSRRRPEWEFWQNKPGFCLLCQEEIATALDIHMMNVHLELGQLWRCPVEWCTVWKGSVSDCLGHVQDKHGESQYMAVKNLGKFFQPWTVSRDFWLMSLRPDVSRIAVDACLFHEASCRLVQKYRVYKDPFPHPALGGGRGVINHLIALVGRAVAIAQLTHLHISIPASGALPGEVPEECFPHGPLSRGPADPRRVSFASGVTVLGDEPTLELSPDRSSCIVWIFRSMTRFALIFRKRTIWIFLLRNRRCLSQFSNPHRNFCIFHGRGRSGDPLCLKPAGFLGDVGDSRLIRRRCRFRHFFRIAWTTRLLPMWAHPGMSQILHPRLKTYLRLLWRIFHSRWMLCRTSWLTPRLPTCSGWYWCRLLKVSRSCPSLATGSGGPLSRGTLLVVNSLFWGWLFVPQHDISHLGLCFTVWRVWCSTAPSPVLRMDWCAGVCLSVGNGTGEVVTFFISEPSYGCAYPAASGCLFDDD